MELHTFRVEQFYDALEDLDSYDLSSHESYCNTTDNFYVREIKEQVSLLKLEREGKFTSFIESHLWLNVNPRLLPIKVEPSHLSKRTGGTTTKSLGKQLAQDIERSECTGLSELDYLLDKIDSEETQLTKTK